MTKTLKADTLYLGDNGRAFCGTLRCAGNSAYHTGRDISGQRVMPLKDSEAFAHEIRCEGCGMHPRTERS